MKWLEFCKWANENWCGCFSEEEIKENANSLKISMEISRLSGEISHDILTVMENLQEDIDNGSEEAKVWLENIRTELNMTVAERLVEITREYDPYECDDVGFDLEMAEHDIKENPEAVIEWLMNIIERQE